MFYNNYEPENKFIFIVGSSRSGTTLLNGILSNHSEVQTFNELQFFDLFSSDSFEEPINKKDAIFYCGLLLARVDDDVWKTEPSDIHIKKAQEILRDIKGNKISPLFIYIRTLDYLCNENGKKYIVDQSGRNILYEEVLLKKIPNAKFLQMIRDPRAVCYSQKKRWKKRWKGGENIPLKNSIRVLFNYHPISTSILWKKYTEIGEKLNDKTDRHVMIKYEELVKHPDQSIRQLCKFLAIEYSHSLLSVQIYGSSHANQKAEKKVISTDSLFLWRDGLAAGEIFLINNITKVFLTKYKYTVHNGKIQFVLIMWLLIYPIHIAGALIINPKILIKTIKRIFS